MSESNIVQPAPNAWRYGFFSGDALKCLAAVLMVCDHVHQMFHSAGAPLWLTMLGRPVLPIFLFMCAEGFYHTRSRWRYMLRLLVAFECMTAANLLLQRLLPVDEVVLMNSAFGTMLILCLLLAFCSMIYNGIQEKRPGLAAGGGALLAAYLAFSVGSVSLMGELPGEFIMLMLFIPNPFFVEGFTLIPIGMLFYALRRWRWAQALTLAFFGAWYFIAGRASGDIQWMMVFAAVPLLLYNGERGRGGKFGKYFFYVFYPAHIYLLYAAAYFLALR